MWWDEVVDEVEDVALMGMSDDPTLRLLIQLAVTSADSNQPVFPPLDEPVLWHKFMLAVSSARETARKAKAEIDKAIPDMPNV